MKDIQTWNKLTAEVARLERENAELRAWWGDWISILESLPDKDERVLTYHPEAPNGQEMQVVGGWICHKKCMDITHWMPLPGVPIKLEE